MNKQFKKWYQTNDKHYKSQVGVNLPVNFKSFNMLPFSMQWGVYLEFFDSIGQQIEITHYRKQYLAELMFDNWAEYFDTRQEAQQEAIKKAFEILDK